MSLNAFLIPPLLTKAVILYVQESMVEPLKTSATKILERGLDASVNTLGSVEEDDSEEGDKTMASKTKDIDDVARKDTYTIIYDCINIIEFLHAVALKASRVEDSPLLLRVDNPAREWFRQCSYHNIALLTPPHTVPPQDHLGITGVQSNVVTQLQNLESLHPAVTVHHEVDQETEGWDHITPMSQCIILEAITLDGINTPTAPSALHSPLPEHVQHHQAPI